MKHPSLTKSIAAGILAAAALGTFSCVADKPVGEGAAADEIGSPCTKTQGFWKNHESAWPVTSLTLGAATYTQQELLELLRTPVKGDASILLAHQLIAALLNVAAGAPTSASIDAAIDEANGWMLANADSDGRLPYGAAPGSGASTLAAELGDTLASFNEEGPCEQPEPGTGGAGTGGAGGFILPTGSSGVGGSGGFILPTGSGP
jgi:hypothetical protein